MYIEDASGTCARDLGMAMLKPRSDSSKPLCGWKSAEVREWRCAASVEYVHMNKKEFLCPRQLAGSRSKKKKTGATKRPSDLLYLLSLSTADQVQASAMANEVTAVAGEYCTCTQHMRFKRKRARDGLDESPLCHQALMGIPAVDGLHSPGSIHMLACILDFGWGPAGTLVFCVPPHSG
jgi:hypothetical protein